MFLLSDVWMIRSKQVDNRKKKQKETTKQKNMYKPWNYDNFPNVLTWRFSNVQKAQQASCASKTSHLESTNNKIRLHNWSTKWTENGQHLWLNYLFKKFKIAISICNLGVTIWRNRILQKAPRECNILALRIWGLIFGREIIIPRNAD